TTRRGLGQRVANAHADLVGIEDVHLEIDATPRGADAREEPPEVVAPVDEVERTVAVDERGCTRHQRAEAEEAMDAPLPLEALLERAPPFGGSARRATIGHARHVPWRRGCEKVRGPGRRASPGRASSF